MVLPSVAARQRSGSAAAQQKTQQQVRQISRLAKKTSVSADLPAKCIYRLDFSPKAP